MASTNNERDQSSRIVGIQEPSLREDGDP
jgi:hypothetical protein